MRLSVEAVQMIETCLERKIPVEIHEEKGKIVIVELQRRVCIKADPAASASIRRRRFSARFRLRSGWLLKKRSLEDISLW